MLTRDPATCILIRLFRRGFIYLSIPDILNFGALFIYLYIPSATIPRLKSLMLSYNFTPTADGTRLSTYTLSYIT